MEALTITKHEAAVVATGLEYRKTATIRAIPAANGTRVQTTEGWVTLEEDGFVATDGASVWPISGTFMKANYEATGR